MQNDNNLHNISEPSEITFLRINPDISRKLLKHSVLFRKIRYRLVCNRSGRLNRHGEALIEIECSQQGRRIYFTTHTYISPDCFSHGAITGSDNAPGLNYTLYKMVRDVEAVELEYIKKGVDVSLPLLKDAVKANISPAARLSDFGPEVVNRSDRKNHTKLNYQTLLNNIDKFRRGVLVTDIDYNFITAYDKWLRDSGIAHNTRIGRLRLLRALLNEAKRRDIIDSNPFEKFHIQQMVSKKGYVTLEQLNALENLKLEGREDMVRDAFLVGCYTGLRFSDIISLRQEHISGGWLNKKMVKTGFTVDIPVGKLFSGKLLRIVEKYDGDIGNLTKEIGGNTAVNRTLRPLLDIVEADGKITFHGSRHTFAPLLGQMGVGITTIQKMLGHQKLATTQIYEEVDRKTIENDIKTVTKEVSHNE